MTIKVSMKLEPVDSTAKAKIKVEDKDTNFKEEWTVDVTALTETRVVEVESGDKLTVTLEAGKMIVLDPGQSAVRVENIPATQQTPVTVAAVAAPSETRRTRVRER